ncbi:LytTR family DNA-binding domain-containing protein [Clostridium estertheticum]|uniref:LytR/AlgR family response regulator transcription factor n=1 Tax=Clostridium estertheticum TaxID=238834 RepID=UPI001C0E4ADD|nr:LytTR family DNA-binding domain-containing protein [Clostridium estertheticum]MBU3218105.1 LytTR family DNA-binding domain-containing protein [Clostridium estertheticum]WAG55282.1 LytTR family DNA-binding domain-containing protein [Clostridium estertheticum]
MNILIVEDDNIQKQNFIKMMQGIKENLIIYEAEDKADALKLSNENSIDIFYIDIFLKNSSGLDLAIDLRKIDKYEFSWIIFLTTHEEYITQAFKEVHCYDYILKPYDKDKLLAISNRIILHSCSKTIIERKYAIFDLKEGIFIKIYVDEIIFIEVNSRTCTVHTKNGIYEIKGISLKRALELINNKAILQSHKSFAVNINFITKIVKLNIKSYELFFEDYEKKALLSYKCKSLIIEKFITKNPTYHN